MSVYVFVRVCTIEILLSRQLRNMRFVDGKYVYMSLYGWEIRRYKEIYKILNSISINKVYMRESYLIIDIFIEIMIGWREIHHLYV